MNAVFKLNELKRNFENQTKLPRDTNRWLLYNRPKHTSTLWYES